jgi:hypothetical protein
VLAAGEDRAHGDLLLGRSIVGTVAAAAPAVADREPSACSLVRLITSPPAAKAAPRGGCAFCRKLDRWPIVVVQMVPFAPQQTYDRTRLSWSAWS